VNASLSTLAPKSFLYLGSSISSWVGAWRIWQKSINQYLPIKSIVENTAFMRKKDEKRENEKPQVTLTVK
jgi:hypothetical protein